HGHHHHTQAASSNLTPDLASAFSPDSASSDGSSVPTDSSDPQSNDTDFHDPRLHHLALTLVQHVPINPVPIDLAGHVNFGGPYYFNQGSTAPSQSVSA